jgi:mannose-6-phosphate isomerase-like protein (cupin superfamily)
VEAYRLLNDSCLVDAIICRPGEGEQLSSDRLYVIRSDRAELGLFESVFEPGEGTLPHTHHRQADAFYVLEGELEVIVDTRTARLGPGGLVAAPPHVTHSVRNPGAVVVRHLNLHAPGVYFVATARARARGEEIDEAYHDSFGPEAGGEGVLSGPGEGELLRANGSHLVKAALPEMSIIETELGPGDGGSVHLHRTSVESLYVLEGELALTIGHETVRVSADTSVVVPPSVVHAIANRSEAPARLLNIHAPDCGFVDYLRVLARGERIESTDSEV